MIYRTVSQNRALHCYLLLSLWILLIVGGIYKFFEWKELDRPPAAITTELFSNLGIADVKTKKIFQICNFPEEIYQGDEGIFDPQEWMLKGVIILIRHGDRGPLQHIKKISSINCNTEDTSILNSYRAYVRNLTISGKLQWTGPGPFHGFPVLPTNPNQCQLGQLTMQGVSQLLNIGRVLSRSYREVWPKLELLKPEEIMVYSTRYRRTFQSALAFLYGLIPYEALTKIQIAESHSMSFCFKDCGCPVTDHLAKLINNQANFQLKSHPAVLGLSDSTGKMLFSPDVESSSISKDPHSVRDALLAFICHRSGLPCEGSYCIKRRNIAGIITYTDWVNYQKWKNIHWKQLCLLRSYGLIGHIVQRMLHMVSNTGPYLVLYSGHDHTISQLTTALGLVNDPVLLRYGARIVFEVYQDNRIPDNDAKGIYFRVLANGRDVTRQISFCKNIVSIDRKNGVCKIEDIVRFLHDDYFSSLNVTNFKDACVRKNENKDVDFENDFGFMNLD